VRRAARSGRMGGEAEMNEGRAARIEYASTGGRFVCADRGSADAAGGSAYAEGGSAYAEGGSAYAEGGFASARGGSACAERVR
jgi:hypothetical protein